MAVEKKSSGKVKKSSGKVKKSSKSNMDLLNLKNKDYNLSQVKGNLSSFLLTSIIINVVFCIILGYIIKYLFDLKKCDCFKERNEEVKANIDYIIIIEAITLFMNIILLLYTINLYSKISKIKSGGGNDIMIQLLFILLNLAIYGYFVYSVYKLMNIVNKDCECTIKPIRFILYLQTFITLIYCISLVISILN